MDIFDIGMQFSVGNIFYDIGLSYVNVDAHLWSSSCPCLLLTAPCNFACGLVQLLELIDVLCPMGFRSTHLQLAH